MVKEANPPTEADGADVIGIISGTLCGILGVLLILLDASSLYMNIVWMKENLQFVGQNIQDLKDMLQNKKVDNSGDSHTPNISVPKVTVSSEC